MKILSPGKESWWYGYKAMCHVCKAILQLEKGDAVFGPSIDPPSNDSASAKSSFMCPCCRASVTIEPGKSLP